MAITFQVLTKKQLDEAAKLTKQLNPKLTLKLLKERQRAMFALPNYHCFGLMADETLVGIASGWVTVRLYSGKQLEIDNVVIDKDWRSQGLGTFFLENLERWALREQCNTIELNTYVENNRSHKFYFNEGFKILGFHFQKALF